MASLLPTRSQLGMIAGALLATACCWLPLGLGIAGVTWLGLGSVLDQGRPFFLALTAGLLLWNAWVVFVQPRRQVACATPSCEDEVACNPRASAGAKWMFAAHVVLVGAVLAFPLVPLPARSINASEPATAATTAPSDGTTPSHTQVALSIEGMTCQGCVRSIEGALADLAGVTQYAVTLRPGRADIAFDPTVLTVEALVAYVENEGYAVAVLGE